MWCTAAVRKPFHGLQTCSIFTEETVELHLQRAAALNLAPTLHWVKRRQNAGFDRQQCKKWGLQAGLWFYGDVHFRLRADRQQKVSLLQSNGTIVFHKTIATKGKAGAASYRRAANDVAASGVQDTESTSSLELARLDIPSHPDRFSASDQAQRGQKEYLENSRIGPSRGDVGEPVQLHSREEYRGDETSKKVLMEFEVRKAAHEEELTAAAWLRAEVYASGLPYTRFIESYKKQFADQEFGSLLKRTKAQTGRHLRCCCLVAVDTEALTSSSPANDYVVGTLDVSLKQLMPGERIPGEVGSDESVSYVGRRPVTRARKYAYVSNVCVPEHVRRMGVAQRMMAAAARVVKEWGLEEVFCHVEVNNVGAQQLYKKLGYQKRGEVTVQENASAAHVSLQRTLLLRAKLDSL